MISIVTNTRGSTMSKEKSLSELTNEYNALAQKAGKKTVKKLRDVKSAAKKIAALRGSSSSSKSVTPDARSAISKEFDCRSGTNREKLVEALASSKGKQVPRSDLLKSVYGNQKEENIGPLGMVLKGMAVMIKEGRLPYKIERTKDAETKEVSFGLHAK